MATKSLRVGILDIVTRNPRPTLYGKIMHGNLASIMPQAIAVWCQRQGHNVSFVCYTGAEDLVDSFPDDLGILFIGAFTQSAQLAYAISNLFRKRGAVTVLGGPHARCYPQDSQKYFDYVLGFTDETVIGDVLADCARHRPLGLRLGARQQPRELPGVQERWPLIENTLAKTATNFKIVPMIGSLGCPYTCSFCIDATVKYQPLDYGQIHSDIQFLLGKMRAPIIGWHDPNFGIRFDDYLSVIERADPDRRVRSIAETSLGILSEPRVIRLKQAGFHAILPGIESWYDMGAKSKTGAKKAREKMLQVSDHVNMIMRHIPYLQANFVLGLDCDEGDEPFELTKEFLDRSPGAFPAYSLFTAFGDAAPANRALQIAGRVLPTPFHFLNNNEAMNIKPKNYEWTDFYDKLIALTQHSFTWGAIAKRFAATPGWLPRWMNVVRAVSSEGFGRIKYHSDVRARLDTEPDLRAFFEGESTVLPRFYVERIKDQLGPYWEMLPEGALDHDPCAGLAARPAVAAE
ncbi:MAG: B12-binding domain-containing radical SAM protein [Maricaulaceae bacterium]